MTVPEQDHDPAAIDALAALGGGAMVTQVLRALADLLDRLPGELREASSAASLEQLQRRAHSILSASGYAGETSVRAAARAIEQAVRAGDRAALPTLLDQFDREAAAARPRVAAALMAWSGRS